MCTKDVACAFSAELGENQRQHIPAPDNLAHSRCLTGGADIIDNKADDAIWLKKLSLPRGSVDRSSSGDLQTCTSFS